MDLIIMTREIVKAIEACGLRAVDDVEDIDAGAVWIENLSKLRGSSNKSNKKNRFLAILNIYELHTRKLKLFEEAEALHKEIKDNFFKDDDFGFNIEVSVREEYAKKVSADVGKLYQYTISLVIKTTPILPQSLGVSNFK